jgi:hypothetical protein
MCPVHFVSNAEVSKYRVKNVKKIEENLLPFIVAL